MNKEMYLPTYEEVGTIDFSSHKTDLLKAIRNRFTFTYSYAGAYDTLFKIKPEDYPLHLLHENTIVRSAIESYLRLGHFSSLIIDKPDRVSVRFRSATTLYT